MIILLLVLLTLATVMQRHDYGKILDLEIRLSRIEKELNLDKSLTYIKEERG